jgi:hypothetical protein
MRWALNAPFKPDAGRKRLATTNPENRMLAEEVSSRWGEGLIDLFDVVENDWATFSSKLNLHADAKPADWWRSLWTQMTRESPVLQWEHILEGGQVLGWVAWGNHAGGMRRLVHQRAVVPSGLPGAYGRLVKSRTLRYKVDGLLGAVKNGCFERVADWQSMRDHFPIGETVAAQVGEFLITAKCVEPLEGVAIRSVLAVEVGPGNRADPSTAGRIGGLLRACAPAFAMNTPQAMEVLALDQWMRQVRFLAKDGGYHSPTDLVCPRQIAEVIERDEVLRASFAPSEAVLSAEYSDDAVAFLAKARGKLAAGAERLAEWAAAVGDDRTSAVFRYLIDGDLGQELADQLGRGWLDANRDTGAFQSLDPAGQSEIERKFLRGQSWISPLSVPAPEPACPLEQVMPAAEAFARISDWWRNEQDQWVRLYDDKTYPPGFPGNLPWRSEDSWDALESPSPQARWLFLFVNAALVPLGFNSIGRHHSFSRFLVANGWLDVLANVSQDSQALLDALNRYLDAWPQTTEYHFQMRQFIAFYAAARTIDAFVDSLYEAERSPDQGAFAGVFSPRASASLTGTGIDAPPLSSMLGIGACQLLRELYRLNRLTNPLGHPFAFTPIRKVRRLCAQVFGTPDGLRGAQMSRILHARLAGLAASPEAATFNHCFDLPLQFLAEHSDLRDRVLGIAFYTDPTDSYELDAAPPDPLSP